MTAAASLDQGRAAFERQAWGEAYAQLAAADREAPLEPEDLERLAIAAHLIGRDAESADDLGAGAPRVPQPGRRPRGRRAARSGSASPC